MDLYRSSGPEIFQRPSPSSSGLRDVVPWIYRLLKKPANDAGPLRQRLVEALGEKTLRSVYEHRGIALCIPAVVLADHSATVFKTPHLPDYTRDAPRSLVDVCLATSAAPIVFPPARVDNQEYVDGGLWANSPILVGLLEALRVAPIDRPIEILTVGTSAPTGGEVLGTTSGWGLLDWVFGVKALGLAMDAQSSVVHDLVALLLPHLNERLRAVVRVGDPSASAGQSREMRLDNPSAPHLQTLLGLAEREADSIHSNAGRDDPDACLISDIIAGAPAHGSGASGSDG